MNKFKNKIKNSFNSKASSYDEYSLVQREVAKRLCERLSSIKIKPLHILDIGCGTGYLSNLLYKLFPNSSITCLDISINMLNEVHKKNPKLNCILSDAENMPFKKSKFDLVVSSFTFHWCDEVEKIFSDVHRFLRDKGLFLFTTVGPSTLQELRDAYLSLDNDQHINTFSDMHLYGDSLLKHGYHDPVMDIENIVIEYNSFKDVLSSLKKTGANTVIGQEPKFIKKSSYNKLAKNYPLNNTNNRLPVTYEMIYGLAWKKNLNSNENIGVIPIKNI
jgi:malonyl-CoA O-methyltransferase